MTQSAEGTEDSDPTDTPANELKEQKVKFISWENEIKKYSKRGAAPKQRN